MTSAEQKLADALAVLRALDGAIMAHRCDELVNALNVAFERAKLAAREYARDPGKS